MPWVSTGGGEAFEDPDTLNFEGVLIRWQPLAPADAGEGADDGVAVPLSLPSPPLRILGRKGRIAVTVHLLEPLAPSDDRKQLALAAMDSISTALAPSAVPPAGL